MRTDLNENENLDKDHSDEKKNKAEERIWMGMTFLHRNRVG